MKIESKPTQVKIKGLRVLDFFDENFIGKLQKHVPGIEFEHFCMEILNKESDKIEERLALAHTRVGDKKERGILTVDTDSPHTLEELIKVIEEYVKEKRL